MINIQFPDGRVAQYESGITGMEMAKGISRGLAEKALGIKVNGEVCDLTRPINSDATVQILTWDDEDGKKVFWHSSAHLMAEAIESLYDDVKFGIGPAIANGYYYDIDTNGKVINQEDLDKIEKKMLELVKTSHPYIRTDIGKKEALDYFIKKGDPYKIELIEGLPDGSITFYNQGNFTDLCKGPHLPETGYIKAIKLMSIAGAYWRGDEKNKQLTRIYGITFPKQKMLEEYLVLLEEAKKRDHRKLGKELELFAFSDKVGSGLPLWLPNGVVVRQQLENFMRKEQQKRGYEPVITPHIGSIELYKTSGHYEKYGADSFKVIETPNEGEAYMLKPMNCPHHIEIYKTKPRSYRDLPVRLAEFGTVYRYEQSGELNGLTRVRGFTQDDAHIFCRPDQVKGEFENVIDLVMAVFSKLGFEDFTAQISLRDPENKAKYIGSDENWERAERAIIEASAEKGLKTVTVLGEAAFYGPKLDFMVKDVLGRSWQLGTIQVDYNLPERFELEYTGADNAKHRPVMIHRAPFGSMERFIGILIEHTAGDFPLWLAPEQVMVIPVAEKFNNYAEKICNSLKKYEIRTLVDARNEKIGRKIREAELKKIPYMVIVGEKEEQENSVSARKHKQGDLGAFELDDFIKLLQEELNN